MSSFDGRLRLPGQAKLPLAVEIDISKERMRLTAGEETVADWPIEGLEVDARPDGFHITVDDEQVVLSVSEATKFAKELNLPPKPPSRPVVAKADPKPPTETSTSAADPDGTEDGTGKHAASSITEIAGDVDPIAEVRGRVEEVATLLTSDSLSPAEAFARWLGLLKEINSEHGQGSMPSEVFFELNTRLLDMIPTESEADA
jgi:hypothetical protein